MRILTQRTRLESGQALVEYHVLFPIALAVLISASLVGAETRDAFALIVNSVPSQKVICETPVIDDTAPMDNHLIELSGYVYDELRDETTITYTVTSGPKPSISHWTLGIPLELRDRVLDISDGESVEWGTDPRTGTTGIKFDTGYEVASAERDIVVASRVPELRSVRTALASKSEFSGTTSREIAMVFSGEITLEPVPVSIKAGNNILYETIAGPVSVVYASADSEECQ